MVVFTVNPQRNTYSSNSKSCSCDWDRNGSGKIGRQHPTAVLGTLESSGLLTMSQVRKFEEKKLIFLILVFYPSSFVQMSFSEELKSQGGSGVWSAENLWAYPATPDSLAVLNLWHQIFIQGSGSLSRGSKLASRRQLRWWWWWQSISLIGLSKLVELFAMGVRKFGADFRTN